MAKIKRCASKVFPCPAGDRCPEHRGMQKALLDAAASGKLDEYLQIRGEIDERAIEKRKEALTQTTIKKNRKGELVAQLPVVKKVIFSKNKEGILNSSEFNVYTSTRPKVNLGVQHPADMVDKTQPIRTSGLFSASISFKDAVEETYDGNVHFIEGKGKFATNAIDDIEVADGYKGKGVESHVLGSYLASSRLDLYDFAGSDKIPYSAYKEQGFEPNPYYWAGQTHPETGTTYPSVAELDILSKDKAGYERGLDTSKQLTEYPYIRLNHGEKTTDIPFIPIKDYSSEQRNQLFVSQQTRSNKDNLMRRSGIVDYSNE